MGWAYAQVTPTERDGNRELEIGYRRGLTAKEFAEVFYAAVAGKHPFPGEEDVSDAKYIPAYAHREK